MPIADGGEGTADALHAAFGGEVLDAIVSDPLGRPVSAPWLVLPDGRAVVEAASAIGLPLLAESERDPLVASSRGLGELVLAALREEPRGCSSASAGARQWTAERVLREVLHRASGSHDRPLRRAHELADAVRLFGPQKGASPQDIVVLERRLAAIAELAPYAALPGSGAAGGLGAAFAALGAELVAGAPAVLDLVGFDERLEGCELVVTGEGQVDRRRRRGRRPGSWRSAARGWACAASSSAAAWSTELPGVETIRLSGDPSRRAGGPRRRSGGGSAA